MHKLKLMISSAVCVMALSSCQSHPAPPAECPEIPAIPAWVMERKEPNLTDRLLLILSPSQTTVTKPSGN